MNSNVNVQCHPIFFSFMKAENVEESGSEMQEEEEEEEEEEEDDFEGFKRNNGFGICSRV